MAKKILIKLGGVLLDAVVNENPDMPADVTEKPVEKGEDISDHMKKKPHTLTISGSMVNDAAGRLATLRQYQKDAALLTYVGRGVYDNLVIKDLNTKHNCNNGKGFDYEMQLQHVRIAHTETFSAKVKNPDTNEQDQKTCSKCCGKKNKGRVQPKSTKKDSGDNVQSKAIDPKKAFLRDNSNLIDTQKLLNYKVQSFKNNYSTPAQPGRHSGKF